MYLLLFTENGLSHARRWPSLRGEGRSRTATMKTKLSVVLLILLPQYPIPMVPLYLRWPPLSPMAPLYNAQ